MTEKTRCNWCGQDELYTKYHDKEWGTPTYDDNVLFEFLVLETFQAGLSWITILRKRENFREAFDGFDYNIIANYSDYKLESLQENKGIIRNKLKIKAARNNASVFIEIQKKHGSFSNYIWAFVDDKPIINNWKTTSEIPAKTELSDAITKDMKKQGFKFVGSVSVYAFMQSIGLVNDHIVDCFRY
ncbi:MAG: DNA-3-methyladenine glycosylase I [Flavobacteriaceae bacterium]|nr:DNA-3-methyladenine glycosylase I [Flavobacteriaceae bacterium]